MSLFDFPDVALAADTTDDDSGKEAGEQTASATSVRVRMVVSYDGSRFRGFAAQQGQRTVGGVMADAISRFCGSQVAVTCAGRTDAGVHAIGQVVHVDVPAQVEPERLMKSINSTLHPHVVVSAARVVTRDFDARRSARARSYRYLVLQSPVANPLLGNVSWLVRDELDLRSMAAGADALLGEHDFRAFCRRAPGADPQEPVKRHVIDARWRVLAPDVHVHCGSLLGFDITARSFCHQMVRSIVGVLVEVGRGRMTASDITALLRRPDRSRGMAVAPSHGLCLVSVDYEDS